MRKNPFQDLAAGVGVSGSLDSLDPFLGLKNPLKLSNLFPDLDPFSMVADLESHSLLLYKRFSNFSVHIYKLTGVYGKHTSTNSYKLHTVGFLNNCHEVLLCHHNMILIYSSITSRD